MVLVDDVCYIFGLGLQYLVGACCASVVLGGGIGFCGLCLLSDFMLYMCSMCGSLTVAFHVLLVCVCCWWVVWALFLLATAGKFSGFVISIRHR